MPIGPGKYGAQAQKLLEELGGRLCVVVMMGGPKGPSFDVATSDPALLVTLPAVLRYMANEIEGDVQDAMSDAYFGPIRKQ